MVFDGAVWRASCAARIPCPKPVLNLGLVCADGRNGVEEPIVVLEIERHDGWMLLVGRRQIG